LGNIRALVNLYKRLNIQTKIARSAGDINGATKFILPGVGSFDYAMSLLNQSGMRRELERLAMQDGIPVLGICVGMQILAKSSDEGVLPGLGWIDGYVRLFDASKIPWKSRLPHMGWNTIKPVRENILLEGLDKEARFYFLHSYYLVCTDETETIATTKYGVTYTSAVNRQNIFGVQFHPEKSHMNGIRLLNNFANL
jgi:glutamine amidotransferase